MRERRRRRGSGAGREGDRGGRIRRWITTKCKCVATLPRPAPKRNDFRRGPADADGGGSLRPRPPVDTSDRDPSANRMDAVEREASASADTRPPSVRRPPAAGEARPAADGRDSVASRPHALRRSCTRRRRPAPARPRPTAAASVWSYFAPMNEGREDGIESPGGCPPPSRDRPACRWADGLRRGHSPFHGAWTDSTCFHERISSPRPRTRRARGASVRCTRRNAAMHRRAAGRVLPGASRSRFRFERGWRTGETTESGNAGSGVARSFAVHASARGLASGDWMARRGAFRHGVATPRPRGPPPAPNRCRHTRSPDDICPILRRPVATTHSCHEGEPMRLRPTAIATLALLAACSASPTAPAAPADLEARQSQYVGPGSAGDQRP